MAGLAEKNESLHDTGRERSGCGKCRFYEICIEVTQTVFRWMVDNIHIKTDPAGNIKPDKEKSPEKIDGVVATIMALDCAIRHQGDSGESVYNGRGLLIL